MEHLTPGDTGAVWRARSISPMPAGLSPLLGPHSQAGGLPGKHSPSASISTLLFTISLFADFQEGLKMDVCKSHILSQSLTYLVGPCTRLFTLLAPDFSSSKIKPWCEVGHINPWKRIESGNQPTHIWPIDSNKGESSSAGDRTVSSNDAGRSGYSHAKRNNKP